MLSFNTPTKPYLNIDPLFFQNYEKKICIPQDYFQFNHLIITKLPSSSISVHNSSGTFLHN